MTTHHAALSHDLGIQRHKAVDAGEGANFRTDLEGLRGIAVAVVVAYHASPALVPGGFIGVDIFFVLSGFLITTLLVREVAETGGISLTQFWLRRARRILPASAVVLAATGIATAILSDPWQIPSARRDIIYASLFALNWRLASEGTDYLAQDDAPSVVLHFWSLGIEEQFYIFWPVLLLVCIYLLRGGGQDRQRQAFFRLAIALGLVSFLLSLYLTDHNQPFAFFGTHTRAWQLLAGATIALVLHTREAPTWAANPVLGLAALLALMGALALFSIDTQYPGIAAVVPVAAACAIIVHGASLANGSSVVRMLSFKPLRFVGRVSYSWYLWHWPVLILGAPLAESLGVLAVPVLVAASFAFAVASYHFVENPLRYSDWILTRAWRSAALGFTAVGLSLTGVIPLTASRTPKTIVMPDGVRLSVIRTSETRPRTYDDGCHLAFSTTASPECAFGDISSGKTVLLLGDSHAAQWFPPLEIAAKDQGWRLLVRTKSACPAFDIDIWLSALKRPYRECREWLGRVLDEVDRIRPDLVIVANSSKHPAVDKHTQQKAEEVAAAQIIAQGEAQIVGRLSASARKVLLVRDVPEWPFSPPTCNYRSYPDYKLCDRPLAELGGANRFPFGDYTASRNVAVLDLTDKLCPQGVCRTVIDGFAVTSDRHHLMPSFAATLSENFADVLKRYAGGGSQ